MRLINLTPHDINIIGGETIKSSGVVRLSVKTEVVGEVNGLPLTKKVFGEVEGLPEKEKGTLFIVSALVAGAVDRDDLIVPNVVRDDKGRIIGCDGFSIM